MYGYIFSNYYGKRAFSFNVNVVVVIFGKFFLCRFNFAGKGTGFFFFDV